MKKILLTIALVITSNAFGEKGFGGGYIHFANDTDGKIRVLIRSQNRRGRFLEETVVEPLNVNFFQTRSICPHHYEIEVMGLSGSINGEIKKFNTFATTNDGRINCHYAYLFSPIIENGKKSFKIRQRIKEDAKLILEEHKNPANPIFINEGPGVTATIKKQLRKEINKKQETLESIANKLK